MNTMSEAVKLAGISFYVAVNDSPISSTRTSELEVALSVYQRKKHVYEHSDHMKTNNISGVKLSLKCRYNDKDKPITIKEDTIISV